MASTPARTTGPAARTVVLVMPQLLAPALVPSAGSPLPSAASASSVSAGSTTGNFIPVPKLLDPKCLEALLGYARLLYAQPHGGKLSVLGGAGNKMHTITSWDPGQQSLEAIIKGFSQWKFLEQEVTVLDLQFSIQEAVQFLIQSPGDKVDDAKSQFKNNLVGNMLETISLPSRGVSDLWKAAQMARARLVVIMAPNRDAGGSVETYHQMVAEALLKTDRRSSTVDCFDLLLLDVSSAEAYSNTCVCMQDSDTGILLSTSFYGLPPACTADLLLDLAYLHLELSAIAVKGIATFASRQHMEDSSSGVSTLLKQESKEASLELCLYSDTDVRLVLFQASTRAIGGCCFTPNGGELRKSRTVFLYKVSRRFPKAQLLALPCATVILALLESPHSRSAVQFWETVSVDEIDAEGHIVLPLSSDRESISVTHLLVWWRERFWLHVLKPRAASDITKGESHSKLEEAGDDNELTRSQGTTLFAPNGLMASIPGKISDMVDHCKRGTPLFAPDGLLASLPGKMSDDMVDRCGQGTRLFSPDSLVAVTTGKISEEKLLNKKHSFEESEESANYCCAPTFMIREKKGTRQLERPARCCATVPETVIGGPDKHSANLTALLAPIRGVFMLEDPAPELVNTAINYVARLLELTEKNDGSLFSNTADIPVARRELYKKMWWELKRLAKRTRKDKTQGQEDLAQAIRAARADFKISEHQMLPPLPALTDKPTEHVHINKRRRCEEVPRDVNGRPIFPIKLGPSLQVYDLGNVVWNRPAFHSEKYIWPAGYKSRRAYASMLNSENRIFYWCEIVDDGQAPEFRLTPEDDENNPVIGISATAVWTVVVKRVGALRLEEGGKKTFANVSGPEYFGFANPTIARLIQQLPNSEKCSKYKRQDYFPNVPMRSTELDAWQGGLATECASSPLAKENGIVGKENTGARQTQEQSSHYEMADVSDRADQGGAAVGLEDELVIQKLSSGGYDRELRGMSWDSEDFRKAYERSKLRLEEFSKHFLASNAGSLFSHYWSAKLKRAPEVIEFDGRR